MFNLKKITKINNCHMTNLILKKKDKHKTYHFVLFGQLNSPTVWVATEYPKYEVGFELNLTMGRRFSKLNDDPK